ncbi:MAG TPA: hypothetical protein VHY58_16115 [Streptosporangiaceae bacterium]|jgi:hypothetical protein|nr:hypothetical protein [Streptosporangiaceae bacterium]
MSNLNGGHPDDISYDGRIFHSAAEATHLPNPPSRHGSVLVGHYHQDGEVVWAEFAGGRVVRGALAGRSDRDGVLHLAYCQLLDDGNVVSGRCVSHPTVLADGRVRLEEHWERYGAHAGTGISVIEEPPPGESRANEASTSEASTSEASTDEARAGERSEAP